MRVVLLLAFLTVLTACSIRTAYTPLDQSPDYYPYIQSSFDEYAAVSKNWLKAHRQFISDDEDKELQMNAPYSLGNPDSDKAVLLVHGLADSPYSFSDIAPSLVQMGFYVQVLLLPGHGSKPQDMMLPDYRDWQGIVDHYGQDLVDHYETVWLGGFSTGANLVTHFAIESGAVDGLLLFSPGFKSKAPFLERFTPLVASVTDWGWRSEENNLARYQSSAVNGANAYVKSAIAVRDLIKSNGIDIPALVVMSEQDSVIDAQGTYALVNDYFHHPRKKMLWFGDEPPIAPWIASFPAAVPQDRIVSSSHMSVLFAEDNDYYGMTGEKRYCENTVLKSKVAECEQAERVWYGAWGATHDDDPVARLTWNPFYSQMESAIREVTQ